MDNTKKPWFAARRLGYGAGLPITWQGWTALGALLAVCLVAAATAPMVARSSPVLALIILMLPLLAIAPFVWLCRERTAGGWKWRWDRRG